MDRKRTAILDDDVAKRRKGPPPGEPEDFERHVPDESRGHGAGEISKAGLGHLVIEGFVGDGGTKQGIEATVEIGDRLDPLAGTGGCESEAQAKRRDDALAAAKLHVFATGVEQRFRKDPLELVHDHAKLSVIHLELLSLFLKQHAQEEFRMDRKKNP